MNSFLPYVHQLDKSNLCHAKAILEGRKLIIKFSISHFCTVGIGLAPHTTACIITLSLPGQCTISSYFTGI